MARTIVAVGAVCCLIAVALGAFGAHALKNWVTDASSIDTFRTGAQYQAIHSIAIILVGICAEVFRESKKWKWAFFCFLIGIALFSGSLYALVLSGAKVLGAVAPLGGLSFMLGWIIFAVAAASRQEYRRS